MPSTISLLTKRHDKDDENSNIGMRRLTHHRIVPRERFQPNLESIGVGGAWGEALEHSGDNSNRTGNSRAASVRFGLSGHFRLEEPHGHNSITSCHPRC